MSGQPIQGNLGGKNAAFGSPLRMDNSWVLFTRIPSCPGRVAVVVLGKHMLCISPNESRLLKEGWLGTEGGTGVV